MRPPILLLAVALMLGLPGQEALAETNFARHGSASYSTTTKKPVPRPRMANKRTNFSGARLNCHPATMTWGDLVRCGYDYPPWALGPARSGSAAGWLRD